MMKVVLLGVVLWAGITFGSHVAPYPLNLIVTSGRFIFCSFNLLLIDNRYSIAGSKEFP